MQEENEKIIHGSIHSYINKCVIA